jgi:hypothetical protein
MARSIMLFLSISRSQKKTDLLPEIFSALAGLLKDPSSNQRNTQIEYKDYNLSLRLWLVSFLVRGLRICYTPKVVLRLKVQRAIFKDPCL